MLDFFLHPVFNMLFAALAFWAGMKTADRYHSKAEQNLDYQLKNQFARLQAGTDAHDPAGPYISQEFANRMQQNGQATMMFRGRRSS